MKLDWEKFKHRFHKSWWEKIKPFIESEECWNIFQTLKTSEREIFPKSVDLFKAFKWTNYTGLKCIIIGQSPYHTIKNKKPYADGLAFSCSYVGEESPSLSILYDAIEDDMGEKINRNPDLDYLAFQDVLLLNLSLTIDKLDKDSFEKHEILWRPFIKHLFTNVLDTVTGTPILIFGKPAEEQIVPYLHSSQPYKTALHPAYYARKKELMKHNKMFTWANKLSISNNGEEIYWDYEDYFTKSLPF